MSAAAHLENGLSCPGMDFRSLFDRCFCAACELRAKSDFLIFSPLLCVPRLEQVRNLQSGTSNSVGKSLFLISDVLASLLGDFARARRAPRRRRAVARGGGEVRHKQRAPRRIKTPYFYRNYRPPSARCKPKPARCGNSVQSQRARSACVVCVVVIWWGLFRVACVHYTPDL